MDERDEAYTSPPNLAEQAPKPGKMMRQSGAYTPDRGAWQVIAQSS